MSDFLDIAADLLRSKRVEDQREDFERVFAVISDLQAAHSKAQLDLNNIEAIFTALELGRIIQSVPETPVEKIPEVIASLKEVIVRTLEETIKFPVKERYIEAPKAYEQFATLLRYLVSDADPKQSVSVITFNYDIAVDVAMYRAELRPNYVIDGVHRGRYPIDLLKLHGSLNWAAGAGENKTIYPLHMEQYLQKYSPKISGGEIRLPIGSKQLEQYFQEHHMPPVKVRREPVIVPPSWNKSDYHQALSNIWAAAAKHLSQAESIFIIGYSLPETDSFFRHLYALGSIGKQTIRRFIVFNPDTSGDVDARFKTLLGPGAMARYEYKEIMFDEAVTYIRKQFRAQQN